MVNSQLSGSDQFQYILWDLLLLERWHRMFIDQPLVRHELLESRKVAAG
jgi:hypothetical protein